MSIWSSLFRPSRVTPAPPVSLDEIPTWAQMNKQTGQEIQAQREKAQATAAPLEQKDAAAAFQQQQQGSDTDERKEGASEASAAAAAASSTSAAAAAAPSPSPAPAYSVNPLFNSKVRLWRGDVTRLQIDCITNAANSGLWAGGGICGAIFTAAGEHKLSRACDAIIDRTGKVPPGQTRLTRGFLLPAKFILHTVGPMDCDEDALISAYEATLNACMKPQLMGGRHADEKVEIHSVALCCISTGIYGYDNEEACEVALRTVREWLEADPARVAHMEAIVFVVFLAKDLQLYEKHMHTYFPTEGPAAGTQQTSHAHQKKQQQSQQSASSDARELETAVDRAQPSSLGSPRPRSGAAAAGDASSAAAASYSSASSSAAAAAAAKPSADAELTSPLARGKRRSEEALAPRSPPPARIPGSSISALSSPKSGSAHKNGVSSPGRAQTEIPSRSVNTIDEGNTEPAGASPHAQHDAKRHKTTHEHQD